MHRLTLIESTHSLLSKIKQSLTMTKIKLFSPWWITVFEIFCQWRVMVVCHAMPKLIIADVFFFLRNANISGDNVRIAQTWALSVKETSASLDCPQRNMTGNLGRKQMMSSRGHALVLTLWWQEHMVLTSSPLSSTDSWFIFKPELRMCHWILLSVSAKPCVWHIHT